MNPSFIPVTAVILNWNRPHDTISCVRSLQANHYSSLEILIVDNGSTDDSTTIIQHTIPEVTLLINEDNLGYAAGNNLAIAHALQGNAAYVLVMNNDTVIAEDGVHELVTAATCHPGAGALVPKIYYASDPTRIWAAGARWAPFPPRVKLIGLNAPDTPRFNQPRELEYATGCVWLLSRAALELLNGFDPGYFMYQEDYDFCYRLRASGFTIRYVPSSHIWHQVSAGLGFRSSNWWYHWSRSVVRFYRVGNRFPTYWLSSFVVWVLMRELVKGHVSFLPSYVRGLRDGWRALAAPGASR